MIIVHHLENSRSQRILWLLEELGLPYEVKRYNRDKTTNLAPAELKAVHPLGKSPVLEDEGEVFAETGAIIDHVLDQYAEGKLRPPRGTREFERYRYWMYAAEGSYMPPLVFTLFLNRMETAPMPFFARPIAKKLVKAVRDGYLDHTMKAQYDYLEAALADAPWLAGGDITAADIIMSFPAEAFSARGSKNQNGGDYPNIAAYLMRFQARDAYKRALERGGPYALLRA
ncbi:glutathione S-transferase family protein [Hyphococcus luteus]|uniref:glutathione transferase n=1 Tax=Hyphococcus luteus TaxID=2058213 RepID=A0A2S7K6F1_9PROT|nr:glutathione S-transferase [Marinicaulis flavus]PQA88094.1 glutathione S-transferase [Marinicaulis flavus]